MTMDMFLNRPGRLDADLCLFNDTPFTGHQCICSCLRPVLISLDLGLLLVGSVLVAFVLRISYREGQWSKTFFDKVNHVKEVFSTSLRLSQSEAN